MSGPAPGQLRPLLVGAPREHNELQARAQQSLSTVAEDQNVITYSHDGTEGEWEKTPAGARAAGWHAYRWRTARHTTRA